jgi:hypothetical protein
MEVKIIVPTGLDISKITAEYPDIYQDDTDCDGDDSYFVGASSDDGDNERDSENEWLTYDGAIECCGFVEGAIPAAETAMEGSGEWAMSEVRKTNIYLEAFERGKATRTIAIPDEQTAESVERLQAHVK